MHTRINAMHVAFCLVNFQECGRTTKSCEKNSSRVSGSDNGKPDRRSNGFRRWKAGSQEYRVRAMESRIAGETGSDNGNPITRGGGTDDGNPDSCSIGEGYVKHSSHEAGGTSLGSAI